MRLKLSLVCKFSRAQSASEWPHVLLIPQHQLMCLSGKTNFRSVSLCSNLLGFMLLRLCMKFLAMSSWALICLRCRLSASVGGGVYFGLPICLFCWSVPLVVGLHADTTPDCGSPVFLFWVLRVVVGKMLECVTVVIVVRFTCCVLWIYVITHPHHSYVPVTRGFVRFD